MKQWNAFFVSCSIRRKWKLAGFFVLFVCCLFSGCGKSEIQKEENYMVYGLENGKTKLKAVTYETETKETEALIEEIFDQFINLKKKDVVSVLPNKEMFHKYEVRDSILYFDFDQAYQTMGVVQEVLCRGALVMTFTQIEGIDSVTVTVNNQPLIDKEGNPIQTQKETDFVDIIGNSSDSATKKITLYFANEAGDSLVKKTVETSYDSSYTLERAVINRLINGPSEGEGNPTLPSRLKVLGISVKDGICYVNFDQTFLTEKIDVEAYIPIYSIVNSLAELSGVQKVQILVNGKSDIMFQDVISLKEPLERKLEYIGGNQN